MALGADEAGGGSDDELLDRLSAWLHADDSAPSRPTGCCAPRGGI